MGRQKSIRQSLFIKKCSNRETDQRMKTQSEDQGEGEGGTREDRERGREREREDERSKRRNETGRKKFSFWHAPIHSNLRKEGHT